MNQSNGSSIQTETFPPENIRSYTKYTKRYFTEIMIFCFVVGTDLDSVFRVDGQIKMTIAELKDMIYEKNKNDFKDKKFDANKLNLWLVDTPYDTGNVKLRTLQSRSRDMNEENIIIQELGGKKLSPVDDIGDIFTCDSKNIRIIVQPPATTVSSTHIIPDKVRIEIKNKVMETFPHMNVLSIGQLVDALALIWHVETMESDSPGPQDDPYFNLKTEPSFFKTNLPRNITKQTSATVDLCLPSYSKSGTNNHNPFYDDPQFKETVSLVLKKIEDRSKDIVVLAGVSGGGKTSTAFGIAVERWSIYIDFSPVIGYYGVHLTSELQQIRGIKPQFERSDQQNEAFHLLDVAVVSRGLLLIKMMVEKKISTPKDWLLAQLQMNDSEIRNILGFEKYNTLSITTLITKINACLEIGHLVLICDEAQILCRNEFGKYQGSLHGNEWNLLQGYVAHLLQHPVKCLLAGTYMHMASGISLITSVGKVPNLHAHIVLKLPFLSHDDVLRNLDAVIDLTHVTPETLNFLGYILSGRPRNCAFFVRMLISTQRSNGKTKDLVLREVIQLWYNNICSDMEKYLKNACEYFGTDNLNPEKAIMDVLRLRVFYNHNFKEAIELLQHSIIPCQSPECVVLGPDYKDFNEIEINTSLESYLVDSIVLFLEKRRKKKMVDVFVNTIITLNNIPSIGNEFDAVFITAIIQKRGFNVQEELNRWKNGQQFDLPSWITSTMKFITTSNLSGSVPISKYVNDMTYCSYAIQPDVYSGSDVVVSLMDDEQNVVLLSASCTISGDSIKKSKVKEQLIKSCMRFQYMECPGKGKKENRLQIGLSNNSNDLPYDSTANEEDNLEREEKEKKKKKKKGKKDLNYDLNYTENTKNYRISKVSERANYHEQIKTSTVNRRHIYISVELPHRKSERSELFRFNEYGDLVIIVDDRNMKHVFGSAIETLVERISYKEKTPATNIVAKDQENSMNQMDESE